MKFAPAGKYTAKLDFDQRCEVLALYRSGVGRSVLAEAYGLDRRTVTHIYNPASPHYKAVREEERRLGTGEFIKQYITENAVSKLKKILKTVDVVPDRPLGPRGKRNASRHAGIHEVKTSATDYAHRIQIGWCEDNLDNAGAGWYYRDADGPHPETWVHNGDDSRVTSTACLEAVKENLVDI
jgi:hypothetical protein